MAVWTLHHTETFDQKPHVYFAAFCDQSSIDALDEDIPFPGGFEIASLDAAHFRSGESWDKVRSERPELAEEVERAPLAVVMHGTVERHENLDYLRETIDVMASLVEHGACAVYDALTTTWWSGQEWLTLVSEGAIFNPFDHIVTLAQPESTGSFWLHTKGLRKFGRPDLAVGGVAQDDVAAVRKMLDRFINFQALGGIIDSSREVKMDGLDAIYRPTAPRGHVESAPYFNTFIELKPVVDTDPGTAAGNA